MTLQENNTMSITTRLIAALLLTGVLHYCSSGFIGTFEYAEPLRRLPWQASYGLIAFVCIVSLAFLLGTAMNRVLGIVHDYLKRIPNRLRLS